MSKNTDNTLERLLLARTKVELGETAAFFLIQLRPSDRKAVMVEKILTAFRDDTLRCLERLPFYELRNLRMLVSLGRGNDMLIPEPLPPLFLYLFGLVVDGSEEDDYKYGWGPLLKLRLPGDLYDIVAPHIGTAVCDIEKSDRLGYERFLWGCLTIYGCLSVHELLELWRGFNPEESQERFIDFLESYAPTRYLSDWTGDYLAYPDVDRVELFAELHGGGFWGKPLAEVSLDDILSAGKTTPYNFPFASHPEGEALCDALAAVGQGGDAAAIRMHWLWHALQDSEGGEEGLQDLAARILKDVRVLSDGKARALGRAIEAYINAIPVWAFRGRTSTEMMLGDSPLLKQNDAARAFLAHQMSGIYKAASAHGLGANAPCPCGSGLRYRDCHGKNVS